MKKKFIHYTQKFYVMNARHCLELKGLERRQRERTINVLEFNVACFLFSVEQLLTKKHTYKEIYKTKRFNRKEKENSITTSD